MFRLKKDEQIMRGEESLAVAVDAFLRHSSSDLVLLLNNETVIALKREKRLSLNSKSSFWRLDLRGLITLSYDFVPLEAMT
jgi:hypothetical protein